MPKEKPHQMAGQSQGKAAVLLGSQTGNDT
jgi:hypothetical protein